MKQPNQPPTNPNIAAEPDQEQELDPQVNESSIRVGDIWLSSTKLDTTQLANLLAAILETPSIKQYLDLIKKDKQKQKVGYID